MYKYCAQGQFRVRENLISTANKKNGDSCTNRNECSSNFCYNKKCTDKFDINQSCNMDYECKSSYCKNLKCYQITKENEKCQDDNECETKKCDSNKKVCIRKNSGENCISNNECKSKLCKGLKCFGDNNTEGN